MNGVGLLAEFLSWNCASESSRLLIDLVASSNKSWSAGLVGSLFSPCIIYGAAVVDGIPGVTPKVSVSS